MKGKTKEEFSDSSILGYSIFRVRYWIFNSYSVIGLLPASLAAIAESTNNCVKWNKRQEIIAAPGFSHNKASTLIERGRGPEP